MSEYFTNGTFDYDSILNDLSEGDIVEFNRAGYYHYAFYIGDGLFVHVTGNEDQEKGPLKGTKCIQRLKDIANNDACRINNLDAARFWQNVGGMGLSQVKERPFSEAKALALEGLLLDNNGEQIGVAHGKTVPYKLIDWNCERYCTYWKHDTPTQGFSKQTYAPVTYPLATAQRASDTAAAAYMKLANKEDSPVIARVAGAAAAVPITATAIAFGAVKEVGDGVSSFTLGVVSGIGSLFL